MSPAWLVATVLGAGRLRPGPGTWGTAAALPLGWLAMQGGALVFTLLTVAVLPLGVWAVRMVTAGRDEIDLPEIVIDELLGVWIALMPIAWGAQAAGVAVERLWPGWIAAFLLFRLFDIWKVGPVGLLDRRKDVWGVMLDDVAAGVIAAVGVMALAALAHL
jgi:phosphatidylglycerophosphatase A